jgi:hypothetical protein
MERASRRHRAPSRWCHLEGEVLTVALLLERNARQLVAQDRSLWHYLVPLWCQRTGASRRAVMIPRPRTATD